MKERDYFEDSASILYKNLVSLAEALEINVFSKYVRFPNAPNQLKKYVKEIQPLLKNNELSVTFEHWTKNDPRYTKNALIFKITKTIQQQRLDELPSPS